MTPEPKPTSLTEPTIALKLKPWTVPGFATMELPPQPRQAGARELPSIALADLPEETLHAMAKQWIVDLYKKAGKPLPNGLEGS